MELGRYRILSQLGQGGMATVYLGEDPMLNRLVAIKVIQAHLTGNTSLIERFTVEAKTIAALRHMNIVEVFDFGVQDNQQYLVMEYIDGQNLQTLCGAMAGRCMDNTVAAAILCQAAEGLTSAEKNGVVHRDIKPENLLFNSEGVLKIADFGIAHIADEQSRTQTGAVLGSPNFMSPEQIEGVRPTHRTDLFSLGGVFYYALTGRLPFTGPSIPVTMRNICEKPHQNIFELNPGADPFLVSLVDALLQKDAANRPEGARWLANQLRSWLNHHGVVDIVEHSRNYIQSLGLTSSQTISEGSQYPGKPIKPGTGPGIRPGTRPGTQGGGLPTGMRSGGFGHVPGQSSGTIMQPTTGAMGPSSKSPLVWVGALIALAVLVLAAVLVWTQMESEKEVKELVQVAANANGGKTGGNTSAGASGSSTSSTSNPTGTAVTTSAARQNTPETTQPVGAATTEPTRTGLQSPLDRQNPVTSNSSATQATASAYDQVDRTRERNAVRTPERTTTVRQPTTNRIRPETETSRPTLTRPTEPTTSSGPSTGQILIKSAPPFAALTVNGKPQGETPMNAWMEVPVGKCHIEIVHRLTPPFDTTITVTAGSKQEFKFKLDR